MPAPGPAGAIARRETGLVVARSEGLAVASLRAMQAGLFSADPGGPWRADAAALAGADGGPARRRVSARPGQPARRAGGPGGAAAPARRGRGRLPGTVRRAGPARQSLRFLAAAPRRPAGAGHAAAGAARASGRSGRGASMLDGVPLGDCGRHPAVAGRRPRAVPQAQPMAGLFADRAAGGCRVPRSPTSTG